MLRTRRIRNTMRDIKYTVWFNKKDLSIRNEKIMSSIHPVEGYEVDDNLDMIAVRFKAPFSARNLIMENAFNIGATIVSVGSH